MQSIVRFRPIADIGDLAHTAGVKLRALTLAIAFASASACSWTNSDGRSLCTAASVGKEMGAGMLQATLSVPDHYIGGMEVQNGGIWVEGKNCDFALNALFADETIRYIIANAPKRTLSSESRHDRLIDVTLSIWKYSDGLVENGFFVTRVQRMKPISQPRTDRERRYYALRPTAL